MVDGLVFFSLSLLTMKSWIPVYWGSCFYIYYFNLISFVLFIFVTVGSLYTCTCWQTFNIPESPIKEAGDWHFDALTFFVSFDAEIQASTPLPPTPCLSSTIIWHLMHPSHPSILPLSSIYLGSRQSGSRLRRVLYRLMWRRATYWAPPGSSVYQADVFQTSLFPATLFSSCWEILRHSQPRWDVLCNPSSEFWVYLWVPSQLDVPRRPPKGCTPEASRSDAPN